MPVGIVLSYLYLSDYIHVCVREIDKNNKDTYNYLGGGFPSEIIKRFCDRIIVKTELSDNILYIYVSSR